MVKTMKVFSSVDMPIEVELAFLENFKFHCSPGMRTYVSVRIPTLTKEFGAIDIRELRDWLIAQGAEETDTVLVEYWWR